MLYLKIEECGEGFKDSLPSDLIVVVCLFFLILNKLAFMMLQLGLNILI